VRRLLVIVATIAISASACASKSVGQASGTTVVTARTSTLQSDGLTGLGATYTEWDGHHTPDPSMRDVDGRPTSNLPKVHSGDEYSSVVQQSDRITSYAFNFPTPMALHAAESFLMAQLPPDAKLLNGLPASTADGIGSCVLLYYQSAALARILGPEPFGDTTGSVGAQLETTATNGSTSFNPESITDGGLDILADSPPTTC
jgi:hypothetical protein